MLGGYNKANALQSSRRLQGYLSPKNDLEYLQRPYRSGYKGDSHDDRSYTNSGEKTATGFHEDGGNFMDGAPMDYSRSHIAASREHHGAQQMAKTTMMSQTQNHNGKEEPLLHDWKAFRENVRDKVSRIEHNSTNVAGAGYQSQISHNVVAEIADKKPLKTFLRP